MFVVRYVSSRAGSLSILGTWQSDLEYFGKEVLTALNCAMCSCLSLRFLLAFDYNFLE